MTDETRTRRGAAEVPVAPGSAKRITIHAPADIVDGLRTYRNEAATMGIDLSQSAAVVALIRRSLRAMGCTP